MKTARSIFRRPNIGTIVFFLLNAIVIITLFVAIDIRLLPVAIVAYVLSVLIALSRFGDWVLCLMTGARKMRRKDMKVRMRPLLEIIYKKAMSKTPGLSNQLRLKVMYTPDINAYAIGRRTICVTEGLFALPDDVVQGILAHEVAHLALRHTHIQLVIGGGNFIMTIFMMILKLIYMLFSFMAIGSGITGYRREGFLNGCLSALPAMIIAGIVWLWTKFCMLFLMWSSREKEYDADKYAAEIGYGFELAKALDTIDTSSPQDSFFRALYSTHPNTHDRISKLQELGVSYYRY